MRQVRIPYGRAGLEFRVPDETDCEILTARRIEANGSSQDECVLSAMANPIGSCGLCELAQGRKTAVIICSDHTRPVPSRHILPHMLKELRKGNPDIRITLLIAAGCHRRTTRDELIFKMGEEIVEKEHIVIHDCLDGSMLREIGTLPSGAKLIINKTAADTDLLVSEGFIEPHFFAGFSGGRKSVLPGVCSRTTILGNHCAKFIASPNARAGILDGNPIHEDMVAAAGMAGLRYIVNVIIDESKNIAAAFAGDPIKAHRSGCDYLMQYAAVCPKRPADIVITSNGGYPMDQNIYQAVKGLTAAEAAAEKDGVIIMSASCIDGTGGDSFYKTLTGCKNAQTLQEEILQVPQDKTIPDQWESQILARVLSGHHVIFVADPSVRQKIEDMKMTWAETLEDAWKIAVREKGSSAKLTVIPDGISVIVRKNNKEVSE